jgi:hypothetical protein
MRMIFGKTFRLQLRSSHKLHCILMCAVQWDRLVDRKENRNNKNENKQENVYYCFPHKRDADNTSIVRVHSDAAVGFKPIFTVLNAHRQADVKLAGTSDTSTISDRSV